MTPSERSAWKADDSTFDYGSNKPVEQAETPQAASSPAQPIEQPESAASTEVSASATASETVPPKQNAQTRIKELLAERQHLEDRLKALETKATPPPEAPKAPSPAADFPAFDAWFAEHPTESWEQYNRALARHEAAALLKEHLDTQQRHQAQQQAENSRIERLSSWTERLNEAKKDPTFIPKLSPDIANLRPVDVLDPSEPVTADNIIAQEVIFLRNPSLMVYLSEHPDEFARIRTLPTSAQIIREMGRLDERVTTGQRVQPASPKLITSASPPPRLVNQRPAEAADPEVAAINSGDMRAFNAAMDAKDRARFSNR